ncbi:MAG: bifunctional heptose 7-phosphate kinase/heptose 1-phosphate adenyltransferase [Desulfonatronovibrio sp.]
MQNKILQKINRINKQKIVILGDIILDHYQWGEVNRISPEAPVPVVYVGKETYRLGGAANVARNIKALGAEPYLIGVVGRDKYGEQITGLLNEEGIECGLYTSAERKTTLKTRVMGNTQQIVRVDIESLDSLTETEFKELENIYSRAPQSQFLIVSDYGKGMVNDQTLEMVQDRKIIVDPKNKNFSRYKNIFIMTPNKKEAVEGSGKIIESKNDLVQAGQKIIRENKVKNLLITMGPEGMVLFRESGEIIHITTSARKVFDVTGAGDTVIGVLGACLESDVDLESGCILANFAAGIVVGQVGTVAASRKELVNTVKQIKIPEINRWK